MNIRQQLPIEQQFELKVFEGKVQRLSLEESHELLIHMRAVMLHQAESFRKTLQQQMGLQGQVEIGRQADVSPDVVPGD